VTRATTAEAAALGNPSDPSAWDAFVEATDGGSYTQLCAWAEIKAVNGWRAERLAVETGAGAVAAQLLVRMLGPTPWTVAYVPRGPFGPGLAGGLDEVTAALRDAARRARTTSITIEPPILADDPLLARLRTAGWRSTTPIQPDRTRLVDLRQDEDALWAGLRKKWRQYVSKARRGGLTIEDAGTAGLDEFYRIYVRTARRAGFVHRARSAYERVFEAFAARDRARLLLARDGKGEATAALMLISCGATVTEPYGGMTDEGAASRANYLLKWEAIRSSRERGFATYDMWGLAHPGIEQFKAGFGGEEVRYAGAFEIVLNRPVHTAIALSRRAVVALARRRHALPGGGDAT